MNDLKEKGICFKERKGEYLQQKAGLLLFLSEDEGTAGCVLGLFSVYEYPEPSEGLWVVAGPENVLLLVSQPVVGGWRSPELGPSPGQLSHCLGHVQGGEPDVLDPGAAVVPQELVDVTVLVSGKWLGQHEFEVPEREAVLRV